MELVFFVALVCLQGQIAAKTSSSSDCQTESNAIGQLSDLDIVDTGFLDFQGEEEVFNQFGEFKKEISGYASRQSPNGLLVKQEKKKRLEMTTIIYPDGKGYTRAEGFRYGKSAGCIKKKLGLQKGRSFGSLVDFDLRRAKKIDDKGKHQRWKGVDDVPNSGRTKKWEVVFEKQNNKLVPLEYNSREDQDGVGDGYTIYKRIKYQYTKQLQGKHLKRLNKGLELSNCKIDNV